MLQALKGMGLAALGLIAFIAGFVVVKGMSDRGIDATINAYAAQEGSGDTWEEELGSAVRNSGKARSQGYSFVEPGQSLEVGDLVDVRIAFPNGADYVVLGKKTIEAFYDDAMVVVSTEEDILRMASARVDMEQYQGCRVYASKYVDGGDTASICNYPVRGDVLELYGWDPNVGKSAVQKSETMSYAEKRSELEKALEAFFMD